MKRLALLILLIIPYISSAQIIHGNVSDSESGEPLEMATVVLERGKTPINYVLTDSKGNYTLRIENIQENDILSVTYMGYEKMNHNINDERIINFKLKPEAFVLKEVEIKGGRIYGRQDTTKYDVSRFITDRDNSLKDALKKLPGINIDKNGAIRYNGKQISRFTVEGMDISGGRYNILNENIKAKDVDKAEVIDHYQPIRSLAKKIHSDDVALNIKLLPQAKDRWICTLKMLGGIADSKNPVIWDGNFNAMQIGKKRQGILNFSSDNIGKDIEQENAQLAEIKNDMLLSDYGMPSWLNQPTIDAPLEEERMRFNHSYSFNYSRLQNTSEDTQVRVNGGYTHNENEQQTANSSIYLLNDGNQITTEQSEDYSLRTDKLNAQVNIEKNNENYYLMNETNIDGKLEKSSSHFMNNDNRIEQSINSPRIALNNNLRVVRNLDKRVISFQSRVGMNYSPSELALKDYNEKFNANRIHTDNAISNMIKRGFFTYEYSLGVAAEDLYHKEHNWSTSVYTHPRLEYKGTKLTLTTSSSVQWKRFFKQEKSFLLLSPQIYANFKSGFRSTFTLFTCYIQDAGGWNNIIPTEYREDYRTWKSSDSTVPKQDYFTVNAGYEYKHALHELFWSVGSSYSHNKSNMINNLTIKDGNYYISSISSNDNKSEQWSAKANISKGWFDINTKASCAVQFDKIDKVNMTNSELIGYKVNQLSLQPKIIFSPKWAEIEYSGDIKYSKTVQKESKDESHNLVNWVQNITLTKTFGNVDSKFNISHYRNDLYSGEKSYFTLADASIIWRLSKVRLSACVKNIFNKKEYSYTMNQGNILSTSRYNLRPREWSISIQWNL